jgi:RHS repeat-associated protein
VGRVLVSFCRCCPHYPADPKASATLIQRRQTFGNDVRQQFTAKERDNETGLDYFGARYYGSAQGRFTTADPLLSSGRPSNPQTWNKYSYTLGNPLKFVDPDGFFEWDASLRDDASLSDKERKRRGELRDAFTNARNKAAADAAKAHDAGKLLDEKFKEINDALNAYTSSS